MLLGTDAFPIAAGLVLPFRFDPPYPFRGALLFSEMANCRGSQISMEFSGGAKGYKAAMVTLVLLASVGFGSADIWSQLSFLSGRWSAKMATGTFEETWMPPTNGSMQGTARDLDKDGRAQFMEFFSIEEVGGKVSLYILLGSPTKSPKTAKSFALAELKKDYVRFENPANAYPSTIEYRRTGKSTMDVTLTGKDRKELMKFRRVGD